MAIGLKTGGRNFVKGKPGGPGRPKGCVSIPKEIRRINHELVEFVLSQYLGKSIAELIEAMKDPETRALDAMVIRLILRGAKDGGPAQLGFLFERLLGKVTAKIDMTSSDGTMSPLTEEQRKKIAEQILKK